jgi:hypothetical protein
MSGKSRRRGRKLTRSQRKRVGRVVGAPLEAAPAAEKPAPVSPAAPVAARAPAVARAPAAKTVAQPESSNVSGELRRIGVVGGLMVALLIAAYFVLPMILD